MGRDPDNAEEWQAVVVLDPDGDEAAAGTAVFSESDPGGVTGRFRPTDATGDVPAWAEEHGTIRHQLTGRELAVEWLAAPPPEAGESIGGLPFRVLDEDLTPP